jgi:hypothetical protein
MADVWAASLFANASSQQMASKALRAARAHAWGGDCALTHPSLTFPTWSPVKRIDMMYCSLPRLLNAVCLVMIIFPGTRCLMPLAQAVSWLQTRGPTGAVP